jgi:hypothetical protein
MEIWKEVKGYEGLYEVSNIGRVKSLSRIVLRNGKYPFKTKEKLMKPVINSYGYLRVILWDNGITKGRTIHQLVAIAFLNHIPCGFKLVVNHKDFNRQNNKVENLEAVTQRANTNQKHLKSTSEYTGVCWDKKRNKWRSQIHLNGNVKYLGTFTNELEASNAYQVALNKL